eukprot:365219-Chlamydomonas_euryale.AAC.16
MTHSHVSPSPSPHADSSADLTPDSADKAHRRSCKRALRSPLRLSSGFQIQAFREHKTYGSELADRHEAVVGTVLHKKPTAVGAVHRNVDCKVLLLQLSHALPEDGGLQSVTAQD